MIKDALYSIVYVIVGGIFDFICYIYEIFYALATLNLFNNDTYTEIVERMYVVLGLIMLFVLSYSLLRAVINPDEFAKGETSFPNMVKNIVISLVIITVLPAVFTVAMNFQNSILKQGSIPKLILAEYEEDSVQSGGRDIAYYAYLSIMYPNFDSGVCGEDRSVTTCRSNIRGGNEALSETDKAVHSGELSFTSYQNYSKATGDGKVTFQWFLGIIIGIFLLWVIANFCFDMALRVIKLTFYQIIAPIPVICRIIPGGKLKDVFSTWIKQTVSVYIEVFVRIAVLSIGIFLVNIITEYFSGFDTYGSLGTIQTIIMRLLLIIGVVMFMKEAPNLISKMFNLDTGGMKLGLMDKLAMGGVFAAGGAIGSLISSRGNPMAAIRGLKYGNKNKDFKVIGQEAAYAATKRDAYQNGITRRQIMSDRLRKSFGFDTKYEQETKKIDYQTKGIDEQIEEIKNQIETAKEPLLRDRVSDRLKGNNDFIKAKDDIENRVKKKLAEEKSNYTASISYEVDEQYDTGILDSNGNHIMATRRVTRTETGNLDALRKFIQKNQHNLNAEQVTKFSQAIAGAEKRLVSQYVADNVTQAAGTDGAGDHVLENLIADIRSDGILNSVMMDASGQSQLGASDRNDILTSAQLWDVLDNLGGNISNEFSALNRQTSNVTQQTIGLEHKVSELNREKQEIQAQKVNEQNRKYRVSSDIASRPPGGGGKQ